MTILSMIIPVYNAIDDVKRLLFSLEEHFDFTKGNVTIIDDCSEEETAEFLKKFTSESKNKYNLLRNDVNSGFVQTCNRGLRYVDGEIIILQNSDTAIPKDFCKKVIDCFNFDSEIGLACPIASCGAYFIRKPKKYSINDFNIILNKKYTYSYPQIPYAEGECFCIRKKVIDEVGMLDEIFGKGYREEIDLSFRASKNGWKIVLIDNLYIFHKSSASFSQEEKKHLLNKNVIIFKERWGNYYDDYVKKINYVNPAPAIEKQLFPIRTFLKKIFFVDNFNSHYVITLFGIKIKMHILRFRKNKVNLTDY